MIEVQIMASGSSGNCYHISDDGSRSFLIECGIRFEKIQKFTGYNLASMQGCLISHSHKDHCKAYKNIMRLGLDTWMSEQTAKELNSSGHRGKQFSAKLEFNIGPCKNWTILPFKLQHDVDNHGFLILSKHSGERLVYITDSYYCRYKFPKVNIYMVECNYSREILDENYKAGKIERFLRDRVLKSHFSLENVLNFFKANDLSHCREIHLLHISNGNGDSEQFKIEVEKLTGIPTYV
ncbi:MAG: MBL fold metallo-hydrolase [Deltaproteobacteria bacterium]|nr:MAG: MBL fold metallo-hydrolase [Deltaproteobacteria bacterium]